MTIQPNISKTMKSNDLNYTTETTDSDNNKDGYRSNEIKCLFCPHVYQYLPHTTYQVLFYNKTVR